MHNGGCRCSNGRCAWCGVGCKARPDVPPRQLHTVFAGLLSFSFVEACEIEQVWSHLYIKRWLCGIQSVSLLIIKLSYQCHWFKEYHGCNFMAANLQLTWKRNSANYAIFTSVYFVSEHVLRLIFRYVVLIYPNKYEWVEVVPRFLNGCPVSCIWISKCWPIQGYVNTIPFLSFDVSFYFTRNDEMCKVWVVERNPFDRQVS